MATTVSISIENLFFIQGTGFSSGSVVSQVPRTEAVSVPPLASLLPEMSLNSSVSCSLLPLRGVLSGTGLGAAETWDPEAIWVASPEMERTFSQL